MNRERKIYVQRAGAEQMFREMYGDNIRYIYISIYTERERGGRQRGGDRQRGAGESILMQIGDIEIPK